MVELIGVLKVALESVRVFCFQPQFRFRLLLRCSAIKQVLHEQIQVSDIKREGAADEQISRFAQQLGGGQIGLLNSPGLAEADIRDRRKIVEIDKSLDGGLQLGLWIPLHWSALWNDAAAPFSLTPGDILGIVSTIPESICDCVEQLPCYGEHALTCASYLRDEAFFVWRPVLARSPFSLPSISTKVRTAPSILLSAAR